MDFVTALRADAPFWYALNGDDDISPAQFSVEDVDIRDQESDLEYCVVV
jgi:hypothetical protein